MTAECPLLAKRAAATIDLTQFAKPGYQLEVIRKPHPGPRHTPNTQAACMFVEVADKVRALSPTFNGTFACSGFCHRCAMEADAHLVSSQDQQAT